MLARGLKASLKNELPNLASNSLRAPDVPLPQKLFSFVPSRLVGPKNKLAPGNKLAHKIRLRRLVTKQKQTHTYSSRNKLSRVELCAPLTAITKNRSNCRLIN